MSEKVFDMLGNYKFITDNYKTKTDENIYKGNKNKSDFPDLIHLLKMTQSELKKYLKSQMEHYYNKENIIDEDGFLYIKGVIPICLTSHMDTTPSVGNHTRIPVQDYYELIEKDEDENITHTLTSPQGIGGDDRCGIWTILNILKETEYRPYIVFCEDEEIGCVGSNKFAKTIWCEELKNCKFLIEIDRRGNNDAVYYDDCNDEFHAWVEKVTGYEEAIGSCSDICNLSDACDVSSVNLSSGYYHEHTLNEKIIVEETLHTKDAVIKLIQEGIKDEVEQFEYETKYLYNKSWYDNYDYENYYKILNKNNKQLLCSELEDENVVGYFEFMDCNGDQYEMKCEGRTKRECIANFLMENSEVCWADVLDFYFE